MRQEEGRLSSRGRTFGANLMKYDVYHVDFVVHHHTFSILLSDGKTRVHGHVRRYLPTHEDSVSRMDVGRRRPRAMILLTRAMGGERFYSSVLKSAESITVESQVNKRGCFAKKKDPTRSFLHALFNKHATLITQYAELRRHGLSLNFTQAPTNLQLEGKSACETAKTIMEENEDLFRITLDRVEFGSVGKKKGQQSSSNEGGSIFQNDILKFYLPFTLQPGFECLPPESIPEDIASPIIPLLRYIGPSHFLRLLSALLCERRIILISNSITRLSMCVRAASSALAQGLLLWRHILIPIVPPHMIRFLSVKAPYLVGILHPYASMLGKLDGLTDVLCVNLDKNELKTLQMANPRVTVPDMLKRVSRKSQKDSEPYAAECLAKDLDEIVKADQTLWQQEDKVGGNEKAKENCVKGLDTSDHTLSVERGMTGSNNPKTSFMERMKNPMRKHVSNAKRVLTLEEKRDYATSVDAAVAFGRMIRSNFQGGGEDADGATEATPPDNELATPKYAAPFHDIKIGSVEACIVSDNEGGEEDVRAALTCFFIHMYGDLGMYLSETSGTFWLDRRKFLLRKKQLGEKENSPTFAVLQKFSASNMFATHVKGRIDDMSMTARDRSSIMPHHIPFFDVCSKYLAVHRLDFSLINIRRIVAKTVLACTRHIAVERHISIRTRALALTEDTPFDGNITLAVSELVASCHECNTNLSVVMSVIWHRLNQTKTSMPILSALHLLKNLVSDGPLTAIIEALDGAGKIHELKTFSDAKNVDDIREVRQAAGHMYGLLVDLSSLFARRQRIAFSKAQNLNALSSNQNIWADYVVGRLPLTIGAQKLHALFRPNGMSGSVFFDADGSVAPSIAASHTPSIMALSRLRGSLNQSRLETLNEGLYQDESDRIFGNQYVDASVEDRYIQSESPQVGEFRSSPKPLDATEEDQESALENREDILAEDLFFEQEQPSLPNSTFAYESGASMLENFNYAVSSRGGSCLSVSQTGSLFDSERSSSPIPNTGDTKTATTSMSSINEVMRKFSLSE